MISFFFIKLYLHQALLFENSNIFLHSNKYLIFFYRNLRFDLVFITKLENKKC